MTRMNGCVQSAIVTTLTSNIELGIISLTGPSTQRMKIKDYANVTAFTTSIGAFTGFIVGDHIIVNSVVGVISGSIVSLFFVLSSLKKIG